MNAYDIYFGCDRLQDAIDARARLESNGVKPGRFSWNRDSGEALFANSEVAEDVADRVIEALDGVFSFTGPGAEQAMRLVA